MSKYWKICYSIKNIVCAGILIFAAMGAAAQQQKPVYNLLWKISGNGLRKPSYLFGTMHVSDRRVFNFSDSVMVAIESCKSFALEVQPDTIMHLFFKSFQQNDTSRDLHKMLGDKEYAELAKKFEEKNGYPLHDNMNPFLAESLLQGNDRKPGDKESFVDAYLYGIARTMNKSIYGLEDASKQFNELMGSPAEMKERLEALLEDGGFDEDDREEMVKVYSTGNLDSVLQYMQRFDMSHDNLADRNKVMAGSIIKHMQDAPIFSAVGVAHLPGSNGVIALLKQAGYTLTPVKANFTGVAGTYKIDNSKIQWVTYSDNDAGYRLKFPADPIKTSIYSGLKTVLYADIANETFYGIYTMPKGTKDNPANRGEIVNNLLNNFNKNKKNKIISRKNVMVNGMLCTDVILKSAVGYQRLWLFLNNNILYYLYMGNQLSAITGPSANRFFNSFESFKVAEKEEKSWTAFKNDTGAFSVKMPVQVNFINQKVPASGKNPAFYVKVFVAADTAKLINYLVRYNDYPPGTYLAHKDFLFNSVTDQISSKGKLIGKPDTIWMDGCEGREIKFIVNDHYNCIARVYVRGNREYLLLKQNLHEDEAIDSNDAFFNSFSFIPYLSPTLTDAKLPGVSFTIKFPSKPKIVPDTAINYNSFLQNYTGYYSTSFASGGEYILEHATVSSYYSNKSIDSMYTDVINKITKFDYRDSLAKVDTAIINGKKGREFIVEDRYNKDERRYRLLIDGNSAFILTGRLSKDELFNETSNSFYTSLTDTGKNTGLDLLSSKAEKITTDLQSTDTVKYKGALGALDYYKFTVNELPYIYTALQKNYGDDTLKSGVRYKMIEALRTVHNDSTVQHLLNINKGLQGKDVLKSIILNSIPVIDNKNGYDTYLNLLLNEKPLNIENTYIVFQPLTDSLEYTAAHFQQLVPMINAPQYTDNILSISANMVDEKKPIYHELLKQNFSALTSKCFKELNDYLTSTDSSKSEWSTNIDKYLKIMGDVKNEPLTNKFTAYYIIKNPKGVYIMNAVIARINNNLKTNPQLTARLMDSLDTRYEVMEAFYKQKQFNAVPYKYRKQDEFGKLCLYKYVTNDDDDDDYGGPEKMMLLGSIEDNGSTYYAYKFMLPEKEEDVWYIGIAGPYKTAAAGLDFEKYNAYTEYDYKNINWKAQAKKLISGLKIRYTSK